MGQNSVTFGIAENDVVGLTESQRTSEEIIIGLSIVKEAAIEYKNLRFPRYQNYYGKCQLMVGAYVSKNIQLQHLNQELLHWRHPELGIIETVGCYFKAYGAADQPPIGIVTNTVLVRERFTSLRFKMNPGVLANLTIQWDVFDAKCGGNVLAPAGSQGKPPAPANGGYNPGNRPLAQGGDPEDFSPNDGIPRSGDENEPPKPIGDSVNASWKIQSTFFTNPPDCQPQSAITNSGVTDPTAKVTAFTQDRLPVQFGCGTTVKRLRVFTNGFELAGFEVNAAPGLTVVAIVYY